MKKHYVVIGGGISGLSASWRLCLRGAVVDLFESEPQVGGLAGSVCEDGYCIDYGPHSFFAEADWIVRQVLDLFDVPLKPQPRTVKFFYRNKFLDYPLTPIGILTQMGFLSGFRVGLSFFKQRIYPRRSSSLGTPQETVEDWAIASFGSYLYQSFFKPYTEQFWKIPCDQLSARSIPTHTKISFFNTLLHLFSRRYKKGGESLIEREELPTYYPRTGFGEIPGKIAQTLTDVGGRIHLNCPVTAIRATGSGKTQVIYQDNGQLKELNADWVISTIPLNSFIKMLNPPPPAEVLASADRLEYRALVVLGMLTEKQNVLNCGYVYMLNRPYNRISELNEFSPFTSKPGENIILVEIPCLRDSAAWKADKEELFDMCIGSLSEDGFLSPGDVKRLFLVKSPAAYPIYRKDYAEHLLRVQAFLQTRPALASLGRCGEFMYMDIDKCLERAFAFVDRLSDE